MNVTAKENRVESYIQRPVKRYEAILQVMGDKEITARGIAYELGFADLNSVKPRLTELQKKGLVEVVGKAYDTVTNRNVSVFRRKGE